MSCSVPIEGPLREARFVERPNRFLVRVELPAEGIVSAHLPDPGRLSELLLPGRRLWLRPASGPGRKTSWTAVLAQTPDGTGLVSVDTTLPNRLVGRALEAGVLPELGAWEEARGEVPMGGSRFDFLLRGDGRRKLVEVKSVTLVEAGVGLFPDAITARGARHVAELAELSQSDEDLDAAVLFVLQRDDGRRIQAARSIDPDFADALEVAHRAGVAVLGRRCRVAPDRVTLAGPVPVDVG